jgi:thiol-disulfide isomerase/thioredoxin
MLGRAGIVAVLIALCGCKGNAPKPLERKEPTSPVSRGKGATPVWLEDSLAKLPSAGTGLPKAGSWNDPRTPVFDAGRESRGLLAGRVLDPYGNGAKNVFIRIEPVDATPREMDGAAIGILTNEAGFFMVKDLPAGRVYTLTAEAKTEGKPLYGLVQTRPPQSNITIALRDDLNLPGNGGLPPSASTAGLPPGSGSDHIPSTALPMPNPAGRVGAGGWTPGVGAAPGSIPATIPGLAPGGSLPPSPGVPPPEGLVPPLEPRLPVRPESTAGSEAPPWRPPAANIPGPTPTYPVPPPGVPTLPGKQTARPTRGAEVALVDSLERPWSLENRSGSLVMLEFLTSTCGPCKRSIPILTQIQSRYAANGLQLIGVLCDEVPQRQRASLAAKYQRENNLNYAVYTEAGAEPGAIRDRFNVEAYPTVVLLDGSGAVLWQGHPSKTADLDAAIRRHLSR